METKLKTEFPDNSKKFKDLILSQRKTDRNPEKVISKSIPMLGRLQWKTATLILFSTKGMSRTANLNNDSIMIGKIFQSTIIGNRFILQPL